MSALAKFLLANGKKVAGSDAVEGVYTHELEKLGVTVDVGDGGVNVGDYDVIVYTDAIRSGDKRLAEGRKLNKCIIARGQLLYEVSRAFKKTVAISGCHGKTTCTAMLAHVLKKANKKFCMHVGGRDNVFSNFYLDGYDFLVTEACEYKKNFLLLKPDIAVILNSDADHIECYGSVAALRAAYVHFAQSADVAVTHYEDSYSGGINFGCNKNARFNAKQVTCKNGFYSFTACDGNEILGEINLSVYGKHNVLNALATIVVGRILGVNFDDIAAGINDFKGVERRFENIGEINGAKCIADYAHHPREIKATVQTAKKLGKGKLFVVFQPHTYSRTKNLFKDFVKVLSGVNNLLIYRTFAAREFFDDAGSALTLSQGVKRSVYGDCPADIVGFLNSAKPDDTVLFLGAGDIYDLAKSITQRIN